MKPYEKAVKDYEEAHQIYTDLENTLSSGKWVEDAFKHGKSAEKIQQYFVELYELVKEKQEVRNDKLKNVADQLRQAVVLTTTQWRMPHGKATMLEVGPFKVSSVTSRTFDAKELFKLAEKEGLLERILGLTSIDKDGKTYHLIAQKWDIDFPGFLAWVESNDLWEKFQGAYDEKEKTPQVKGPKPLAFLGEKKD